MYPKTPQLLYQLIKLLLMSLKLVYFQIKLHGLRAFHLIQKEVLCIVKTLKG